MGENVYSNKDREELLIQVATYDGSTRKAAAATGVPRRTLQRWWDGLTEDARHDFIVEAKKRQEGWWQELHDAALQVAREKIQDLAPRDAVVAAGIAFDKLRLIRGEATEIGSNVSADAETLAREVETILSNVRVEGSREARESLD